MPAFNYTTRNQIEQNIKAFYARRRVISRLFLTHDEYVDTFVPSEARQMFRDIAPYSGITAFASAPIDLTQFGHIGVGKLYIRGDRKFAPPLVRGHYLQGDAPAEVVARIKTWLENGGDVHGDFGRVLAVFNYLNEGYGKSALRHYWPTIMALCDNNEHTQSLVSKLQVLKAPASMKPLPPGVIQACRKTASTIATAQLIPHDVSGAEIEEVSIEADQSQRYVEDGIGEFFGMN
jgi:hypothetical protein